MLRAAEAGVSFTVTVRGRPVARLVPPGETSQTRVDVDRATIQRILEIPVDAEPSSAPPNRRSTTRGQPRECPVLDTSVLIAHAPAATEQMPSSAAISVVTLGEMHAGVLLARDASVRNGRRQRLDAVRAAFAALDVDETVAERYGTVLATAREQRRVANASDLLIIATAAAHERTLYTFDVAQARLAKAAGVHARTA